MKIHVKKKSTINEKNQENKRHKTKKSQQTKTFYIYLNHIYTGVAFAKEN